MPFFASLNHSAIHLGAFDAAPTSGRQTGEGKYAEHALQKIYAVTLLAVELEQEGKQQQAQDTG